MNSNFWEDSVEKKRDRVRVADLAFKAKDLLIQQAIPGLFFRKEHDNEHIQFLIKEAKNMLPESIAYSALAMRNREDHSETIQADPNDFLMIHGVNDPLISIEVIRERISKVSVKFVELPNAGHMAHIEQSAEIPIVLESFLWVLQAYLFCIKMFPSLRSKCDYRTIFIDVIDAVLCIGDVSNHGHVRIAFDLVEIVLLDGEKQFVILATI